MMQIVLNKSDAGMVLRKAREAVDNSVKHEQPDQQAQKLVNALASVYHKVSNHTQFSFEFEEVCRFL